MRGESVQVGYKIAAVVVILHADKFAEGTVIIAQMEIAGSAYSTKDHLLIFVFMFAHIY